MIVTLDKIDDIVFDLHPGDRIFLRGNLGAGKTTFVRKLIQKYLGNSEAQITSPTYTYYQKYGENLYHFDLYRAQNLIDIIRTGAQDIFDDDSSICVIEWPEILGETVQSTVTVDISAAELGREFRIVNCQAPKIDN
ncbi:tRNA (adenosine(37)-N6)-threonylcarbamoyltransferase complex ATPase subunit type 1 TsaE [Candidatus Gracilibacteria bacterium]|nr:tRNA (adenosine(37)-N6)-threonylcarbamoyltransferase complex ATPase subunit type 1 TsaE [Candidatus Gracilibacteria bacterium]